jgi:tetratricopeptide (TPR) repeat protein
MSDSRLWIGDFLVSIECRGCGSTLNLDPLAPSWTCDQCGRVNVNQDVVAAALRPNADRDRAVPLVDLGRMEFEAGDYDRALARFEDALVENPQDGEVWGLAAIATVRAAGLGDEAEFARAIVKAHRCIDRARQCGASEPFVAAVSEHVESFMLRTAIERVQKRANIPRVGLSHEESSSRHHQLAAAIQGAFAAIQASRAGDDDRFNAALRLRELNWIHGQYLRGDREISAKLDALLEALARGNAKREAALEALRASGRTLLAMAILIGVMIAAIVVAVGFVDYATR